MTPQAQMMPSDNDGDEAPTRGINDQLRQMIMSCGTLAQQIPEAQQELTMAAKALTAASLKVVASQQEPATGQPVVAS